MVAAFAAGLLQLGPVYIIMRCRGVDYAMWDYRHGDCMHEGQRVPLLAQPVLQGRLERVWLLLIAACRAPHLVAMHNKTRSQRDMSHAVLFATGPWLLRDAFKAVTGAGAVG